uniref:IRG-type G domain-containing protein n=1 Tax=Haplochromis burtoni TaxID=8153 RepID=A0A3Q2W4N1_HAPBU
MEDPNDSHPEEIPGVRENNDTAAAAARIQQYLERENNVPLNIAITGESGSGKSTFGAAPTGVTETTSEVKPYLHPKYPNVTSWDLPGIGTTKFPAKKYLELVGFENFDFFIIIISDTRFRENDVKLAQEIQRMKKKFYFVRSKIDDNLRAERRKRDFIEEETVTKIKDDCVHRLRGLGIKSPLVFLSKIKYYATVSAAVAAVPLPGLSIAVDLAVLVGVVTHYVHVFGLDIPSLKRLSDRTGVPYADLCAVIISPLAAAEITKDLLLRVMTQLAGTVVLIAAEEATRWIPVIGIPVAMGLSFTTTYKVLNLLLEKLADDAQRVFERTLV